MKSVLSNERTLFCFSGLTGCLRNPRVGALLLALAGIAVRAPALQGQLVWDDYFLIRDNPFIKSPIFIFEVFRHYLFPDSLAAHYRPVQNLSLMADYLFWNNNLYGFHLTSLFFHVASGILLYFLLRHLLGAWLARSAPQNRGQSENPALSVAPLTAFLVALLWIVHPVHSAAVDYISGRADSLAFFFACSGWLLFIQAQKLRRGPLRYLFYSSSIIAGLLALCSREIACVWFALFLLHLFFFAENLSAKFKLRTVLSCVCLLGVFASLRQLPPPRESSRVSSNLTVPVRAVLMLRSLGDYGRLMVFPSNLHMERSVFNPENYRSARTWKRSATTEYLSVAGLGVLALLVFGAAWRGGAQRMRVAGGCWFLVGYFPVSNFFELYATVAEHWLYLPSVGLLIFLAGCSLDLPPRFRKLAIAVAGVAVVALSARSVVRSTDWVTEETFYRRTLAAGGDSSRLGSNLGQICASRGDYAEAEKIFRRLIEINPDFLLARTHVAEILSKQGRQKEAEALVTSTHRSASEPRKVASFQPELLRQTQEPEAALRMVEEFAQRHWWHYGAAVTLGRLYRERGDIDKATASLWHASWLDVHDAEALTLIAQMQMEQNRFEDAHKAQRRAVSRQPDRPRGHALLSHILEKLGRSDEARAATAQAVLLKALARRPIVVN